ncbi:MAG: hypothetical protein QGH73_06815 [Rhodospirillales bacterium]|jgi:hypothetical protein|nr:hypothetical protein [Rhodospirillales bacterium]MDP6644915.1 hypothetical protein [Rhodospirillales bacterium]MDP6841373.1 hypothetical protein [Rhodospirillales bacterium]|tara:strand:+ start:347 stop:709 length:363 start_codon:yes stop_codon:yes gene_type:complete
MAEISSPNVMSGEWLFSRLPGWVIDTLSAEQKEAIYRAAEENAWDRHPVNIRFSLPIVRRRYFLTVVGGEEKRSAERRAHEKNRYPLRTAANVFFFIGIAAIFYLIGIVAVALQTSLVEF